MKRDLWTVAAAELLALCATSCGGGGRSRVADTCNRLQTCGDLAVVGASTLAECTDSVNQQLNAMTSSDSTAFTQSLDECQAKSDCPSFSTCLSTLVQSIYAKAVCNQLQGCGSLSLLGSSGTLANCETYANQLLNGLSGSQQVTVDEMIGQCVAGSDCTSFLSCISALLVPGTGTSAQSTTTTTTATAVCTKLESCGTLATVGAATAGTCAVAVGQVLGVVPSNAQGAADLLISECLAVSDCTSFSSCLSNLVKLATTGLGGH